MRDDDKLSLIQFKTSSSLSHTIPTYLYKKKECNEILQIDTYTLQNTCKKYFKTIEIRTDFQLPSQCKTRSMKLKQTTVDSFTRAFHGQVKWTLNLLFLSISFKFYSLFACDFPRADVFKMTRCGEETSKQDWMSNNLLKDLSSDIGFEWQVSKLFTLFLSYVTVPT